jgi:hypothetical protein
VSHKINRLKLPESANVVWAWQLDSDDADAAVQVRTATGWMKPAEEGLAGYGLDFWIVPTEIRVGSTLFRSHGPFTFSRPEQYQGWLFARVLDQNLHAEYKDAKEATLTFEQAYPGEEELYQFSMEVKKDP